MQPGRKRLPVGHHRRHLLAQLVSGSGLFLETAPFFRRALQAVAQFVVAGQGRVEVAAHLLEAAPQVGKLSIAFPVAALGPAPQLLVGGP